ncbi:hypothetical protein [Stenotrophomonas sp. MYb57]|uniref:hypothetical protein n=1 Tax=Stenotrophomonas sp. MYb57 TaxID=1827305 RepID=UPI00131A48E2|nr:hypothetical protein [Stenotrophomonas sp. MYb57]
MNMEDQSRIARSIGRDIARERALFALIGSPRKNEPAEMQEILRTNFEIGRGQIPSRLVEAGLPDNIARTVEDAFAKTATAILNGVANSKYQPALR